MADARPTGSFAHAAAIARDEFFPRGGFYLGLVNTLPRIFPAGSLNRIRPLLYNALGVKVGRSTLIAGTIRFSVGSRPANLTIGERCYLNAYICIDAAAAVAIGDGVSIGHDVSIITSSHEIGVSEYRAGTLQLKPVMIGSGAWIAAGATLLPGTVIGPGAIVAAGAVVTKDVPANTLAAGVPAKVVRTL